jgi:oxygen-independent coproporphyrinogen-3 oxidase
MITEKSCEMMRRSFERTTYRFTEAPRASFRGGFGIYVHVPFCLSKCSFCPFYKELYDKDQKERYVSALCKEIDAVDMTGQANWIYFGGGTPNTLTTSDLRCILKHLRAKVQTTSLGIELQPALLTSKYLQELADMGFTKVSMGVESFSPETMAPTGRRLSEAIPQFVAEARAVGLWTNIDMMVGLPRQTAKTFRLDIRRVSELAASQVTIYPFMAIRGVRAEPSLSSQEQFDLIEEADTTLQAAGYRRRGIWTWTRGDDLYDSSRDELVADYAGFGPAAFSTYGQWKVVNPELDVYLENIEQGKHLAFVARKVSGADEWRCFARMIYDLRINHKLALPAHIKGLVWLLKIAGYINNQGELTRKGRYYAHELTKAVVESLPFPVQNPACVENYEDYASHRSQLRTDRTPIDLKLGSREQTD